MKLLNKIKNKTANDSMLVLFGNLVSQTLSLVVAIVVSRILSVADYGVYSILNNISSFVQDMADMGMNSSITRFVAQFRACDDKHKENQIIYYSLKRKSMNTIIVFTILILFAKLISFYWLQDESKYLYVYLIAVTCSFSLFVSAFRSILQGRLEFKKYVISVIVWSIVWAGLIILMALTNKLTVSSSIMAGAASGAISLVLCINLVKLNVKDLLQSKIIESDIKRLFNNFGNWMMLWALFAILQSKLDIFMLAFFTTTEEVSYYDIASKVIKPLLMVVSAYAQVLNPQFASIEKTKIKKRIKSVSKFIAFISVVIILAIFFVEPAIKLFFGNRYDNSILPAQLLLFAIIFYVWTVPFNSALYALNKPYIFTLGALLGLIVTAVGDYWMLNKYGAVGAALTYILAQIVGLILSLSMYLIFIKKEKI